MAEIVKNLSEGSIELPQVTAPGTTTDKLYNVAGALTFNGTDISAGGIAAVVDDTSPQLGGALDVNGYSIISAAGVAATNPGDPITVTAGAGNTTGAGGALALTGGAGGATGDGGAVGITGGYGAGTGGGDVAITGGEGVGVSAYGGKINITAGHSEDYIAGTVTIAGGQGAFGGGYVYIHGGQGTATEQPGLVLIRSGSTGGGPHNASDINIEAGISTSPSQGGGDVRIRGGASTGSGTGGTMGLYAGAGGSAGSSGGAVNLRAGAGSNTGGHIDIKAGNAVSATSGGGGGDITLDTGSGDFAAGTQEVDVGGTRVGGDTTGLLNDATVYTASIVVDGGSAQPIAITGSLAQTYTTLLSELNTDTTGAVWSLVGGNLLLTSDSTGATSTIAITDTNLFSTLTTFVAVNAATAGTGYGGAIIITTTTVPLVTTNKLYNIAGALTWDGVDISGGGGGGLNNVVEDLTPQLGGDLDTNDFAISNYGSVGVTVKTDDNSGAFNNRVDGAINILGGSGTIDSSYGSAINIIAGGQEYNSYFGAFVNVVGGASPAGGGHVNITGGDTLAGTSSVVEASKPGDVVITGGAQTYGASTNSSNYGGNVLIYGGTNLLGKYGGSVYIGGGIGGGSGGSGGVVDIRGAAGDGTNVPGTALVRGGFTGVGGIADAGKATIGGGFGRDEWAGGDVEVLGGGGQSFGGSSTGNGGAVLVRSGDGGAGSTGGDPGDVTIEGGDGKIGNHDGGDLILTPGSKFGTGTDGAIIVTATTAPGVTTNKLYNIAGALTWNGTDLTAGGGGISNVVEDTTPQLGGNLDVNNFDIVAAPPATATSNGNFVDIIGGAGGATSGDGGRVNITSGQGDDGGRIHITGADAGTSGFPGGVVLINAGASIGGAGAGGEITLTAGNAAGTGNGGAASVIGGAGGATSGAGGWATLTAGDAAGTDSDGGNVVLNPGDATGTGSEGAVQIGTTAGAPTVTTNKMYNVGGTLYWNGTDLTAGGGGGLTVVNVTTPTATAADGDATMVDDDTAVTAGTQEVDVGGTRVGGDTTGLLNDATVYTASVVVDGGSSQPIAVTGSTAQTYTALLSELNTDTTGAVWSLVGGNLLLTSSSTGVTSTIAITDTNLFSTLTTFVAVNAATAGTVGVTITLPAGSTDAQVVVKKLGTTGTVTVDGDTAETIDGALTFTLTAQYASLTVIWNGTEWSII